MVPGALERQSQYVHVVAGLYVLVDGLEDAVGSALVRPVVRVVVELDDPAWTDLGVRGFDVAPHGLVRMVRVDVHVVQRIVGHPSEHVPRYPLVHANPRLPGKCVLHERYVRVRGELLFHVVTRAKRVDEVEAARMKDVQQPSRKVTREHTDLRDGGTLAQLGPAPGCQRLATHEDSRTIGTLFRNAQLVLAPGERREYHCVHRSATHLKRVGAAVQT